MADGQTKTPSEDLSQALETLRRIHRENRPRSLPRTSFLLDVIEADLSWSLDPQQILAFPQGS